MSSFRPLMSSFRPLMRSLRPLMKDNKRKVSVINNKQQENGIQS